MIGESWHWKLPLLKSAKYLSQVRLGEKTTDRVFVRIEKEIFLGFYSVRKLLETFTVSDTTKSMKLELTWHKAIRPVDYMNVDQLDKNYDLESSKLETRDIMFICNQFIHSYVFLTSCQNEKFSGVYVSSDQKRHDKCYFITTKQICKIFRTVGRDDPSNLILMRDPGTGQFSGKAW